MNVTIEKLVAILRDAGKPASSLNVSSNWPIVENELVALGIGSTNCLVAAIATIAVETGSFSPVKERGGTAYLSKQYDGRSDLGNVAPGDGERYRGRGFVQITGRANYRSIGKEIGIDLEGRPDLALDPAIAAKVFAVFFRDHHVAELADGGKWELIRRRVNGGLNGWAEFVKIIEGVKSVIGEPISIA
jgi:hypothetical protein